MHDESASLAISPPSSVRSKDPSLLAKLYLKEGKTFKSSALEAGYSLSVARKGADWLCSNSSDVAAAFRKQSSAMAVTLDNLKPLAIKRLHSEIVNDKSPHGMKAIELAGRFKEADWFVRNADASVGVFVALGERKEAISAQADVIDTYSDE